MGYSCSLLPLNVINNVSTYNSSSIWFSYPKIRVTVGEKVARSVIKLAMVEEPTKARNIKIVETIGTRVKIFITIYKINKNQYTIKYRSAKFGMKDQISSDRL